MATQESGDWKERYLRSLDDLETRERSWSETEKTLRQSLSRLTLAVDTPDRQLREELDTLRTAIRKNATSAQIARVMEDISNSMLRLDETQKTAGFNALVSQVEDTLEQVRLPKDLRKPTRSFCKRLHGAEKHRDIDEALTAYGEYVTVVVRWLAEIPEQTGTGLIDRLFGRRDTNMPPEDETSGQDDRSVADVTTDNPVLVEETPEPEEEPAPETRTDEPLTAGTPETTSPQDDKGAGLPEFNQVLLDLLHRLDLPDNLEEAFRSIAGSLRGPASSESATRAITQIADLMARARHQIEQEKRDIETFLSQLTGHLEQLDRYLEDSVGHWEEAERQNRSIDDNMSAEVAQMHRSVDEAQDIHQLKSAIQNHLNNIQLHMDARQRLEHDRLQQAQEEIRHLHHELDQVQEESFDLRRRLREARDRALHDALTGLNNRLAYDERIEQECDRWERYGRPAVLSIWDVDFFKKINDKYGHNAGDNVLRILAQLLHKSTRKSDFLARFGGEEFMLLLPETEIQAAFEVAEKLRKRIAESRFQYRGQPVPVTMSCGMAEFIAGDTPDDVYRRADTALYEAKRAGRNCCKIYGHSTR